MNQYPHPRLGSWTMTQLIVIQFCVVTSHGVAVLLKGSQGSCADAIRIPLLFKGMLFQQSEDLTELNLTKSSSSSSQLWGGPQVQGSDLAPDVLHNSSCRVTSAVGDTRLSLSSGVCSSVSAVQSRDEAQAKSLKCHP